MTKVILATCCLMALLPATAQKVSPADELGKLEKAMYRLYATDSIQQFMEATERLKTAARHAGNESLFYRAWSNQALYHSKCNRPSKALEVASEERDYAEKHGSKYGLFSATQVSAGILKRLRQMEKAKECYLKAIDYARLYFPDESTASCYLGLAEIESGRGHYDTMIGYARQALADPHIRPQHLLRSWSQLCAGYGKQEDTEHFNEAYAEREKVKARTGQNDGWDHTLQCYRAIVNNQYDEALQLIGKMPNNQAKEQMYFKLYKRMGDYRNALFSYQRYITKLDSFNTADLRRQSTLQAAELNTIRAENEAKDLRLSNQELQMQQMASDLEQERLEAEAARLQLEKNDVELANATIRMHNDSLDRHAQQLKLREVQSRMEAEESAAHARTILMVAGAAIALLTITFLTVYLRRRQQQIRQLQAAYDQLEETTTAKERIESELRIARDIQMSMVPHEFPQHSGLDLYASMTPAREVGGDLYDYFQQDDQLYICLGDVSGKGVPASLFMAQATRLFRALAKQGHMPAEIATSLNDELTESNDSGMFVTMFIGLVNLQTGHLDFCNAGHNPPVIGGNEQHGTFIDMEPNAPIGLWPGLEYVGEHIDSIKGRPLFVYTDGLNEAENRQQEQFGDDRLLSILRQTRFESSRQVIERLQAEVEHHRDGAEPNDDLTMLCLKISN